MRYTAGNKQKQQTDRQIDTIDKGYHITSTYGLRAKFIIKFLKKHKTYCECQNSKILRN